jgi:hypothetical protein
VSSATSPQMSWASFCGSWPTVVVPRRKVKGYSSFS